MRNNTKYTKISVTGERSGRGREERGREGQKGRGANKRARTPAGQRLSYIEIYVEMLASTGTDHG